MISGHVAINKQSIASPSKERVVFTFDSVNNGVTLNVTTNSYSILIKIDVSFVLMFLVTIITGFAIVFSTLQFTCTNNVICEQLFTLLHINVIFHNMKYQHGLSDRGILKAYKTL